MKRMLSPAARPPCQFSSGLHATQGSGTDNVGGSGDLQDDVTMLRILSPKPIGLLPLPLRRSQNSWTRSVACAYAA